MTVEEAARALCAKLRAMSEDPQFDAIFVDAWLHGNAYKGPNWKVELETLEKLLGAATPDPRQMKLYPEEK